MEVWGGNAASDNGVVMPGLDAWVFSRPHAGDAGGGDVHYVSSCATGRITRLLVADVSGHGAGVADIAVTLRNLMRRFINYVDQTRLVRSLNKEFTELSQMGRFATAVVATYWAPTNYLVICNAGHPHPFLYRAKTKTWEVLAASAASESGAKATRGAERGRGSEPDGRRSSEGNDAAPSFVNLPLGIDDLAGYSHFGVELRPGDLVLFYTDSIIECVRADTGRMLAETGVLELLSTLDATNPPSLIPALTERLAAITGGESLDDDLTLLLLRHNGTQVRGAAWQGLLAPLRIAKSVARRLTGRDAAPAGLPEISLPTIGGAIVPSLNRWWKPGGKA